MALKRPLEKTWNWKQRSSDVFPRTPGANGCFLAPSGQGKTTTLISLLLGPYSRVYDAVYVFCPSVALDSAWDPVRDYAKGRKDSLFSPEWDEGALWEKLNAQRDKIVEVKKAKSKKPLPQILVIIDDFADRPDIMHHAANVLTSCFIRGRHFGWSTWLSSQKPAAVSLAARVNFRFMCVWRRRNQKEILALMEEWSALYPLQILAEMYEAAISDEDHSFWYINLVAKKKEDMFHVRFEHKMVLDG